MYQKLQLQSSCNITYPINMVCFWYEKVNTLQEGDHYDDDDDSVDRFCNEVSCLECMLGRGATEPHFFNLGARCKLHTTSGIPW
jgi:hypothetical protein